MNILHSLSFPIITAICWSCAFADGIQAPASIKGATINLDGELYYPGDITIEQYEPGKNTARVILTLEYYSSTHRFYEWGYSKITGTTTQEKHAKQVKPALITFTGQKGRIYSGTISGHIYQYHNYKGKESEDSHILKNEKIEFILPDDDRPVTGSIQGPEILEKGSILQIRTNKRTLTCEIGKHGEVDYYFPKRNGKEAKIDLTVYPEPADLDISLHFSASDTWDEPSLCILNNIVQKPVFHTPSPYIVFTEKRSDKIYKGAFFGYLYGYTKDRLMSCWTLKFKEKLLSITIILPS